MQNYTVNECLKHENNVLLLVSLGLGKNHWTERRAIARRSAPQQRPQLPQTGGPLGVERNNHEITTITSHHPPTPRPPSSWLCTFFLRDPFLPACIFVCWTHRSCECSLVNIRYCCYCGASVSRASSPTPTWASQRDKPRRERSVCNKLK